QAEQRAAIPDKIEFHVAAATVQLEVPLAFAVRHVPAALDDRRIGAHEACADRARQAEGIAAVVVVVEKTTDAARLVAMLEPEMLVAPVLEARIDIGAEWLHGIACYGMPVTRVVIEQVIRREVVAAAEPP